MKHEKKKETKIGTQERSREKGREEDEENAWRWKDAEEPELRRPSALLGDEAGTRRQRWDGERWLPRRDSSKYLYLPWPAAAAAAKSLQSCPTLCNPQSRWQSRQQPTRLPHPWDSPGKNTGVGCHFLLQCMKVKSEREVAQSCPTLSDPKDCSLPGSSVHEIFQARVLE